MSTVKERRVAELYHSEAERFRRDVEHLRNELAAVEGRLLREQKYSALVVEERDRLRACWNSLRVAVSRARPRVPKSLRDSVFVLCHPHVRSWLHRLACTALREPDLSCDECGGEGFVGRDRRKNIPCDTCAGLGLRPGDNSLSLCKGFPERL